MKTIKIQVNGKIAISPIEELVCGNSDYSIEFDFSEEWQEHDLKTARFIWNGKYADVIFSGNTCSVPIITNTNICAVGVFAGDLSTTTPAQIKCRKSILCESGVPDEPAPDVYAQLMQMIEDGMLKGEDGKSAYDIAVENGFEGTEEEWLDYISANASQYSPHTKGAFARDSNAMLWYTIAETGASRIPRTGIFKVLVKDNSGNWDEILFVANHAFDNRGHILTLARNKKGNLIQKLGFYNIGNSSGVVTLDIQVNATKHASNKLEIVALMMESKFDVAGINKWKLTEVTKSTYQASESWNRQEFDIFALSDVPPYKIKEVMEQTGDGSGQDGFSPTVDIEPIENGHRVTITDINGDHSFDVLSGQKGEQGEQGIQGEKGDKGDPYVLTEADKAEIGEAVRADLADILGDIDSALDELHTYAQNLVNGGAEV